MKKFLFLLLAPSFAAAQPFTKIEMPDLVSENQASSLNLGSVLQQEKHRTTDMLHLMAGSPVGLSTGPALQAQWTHRLSPLNPIFLSSGLIYFAEKKNNDDGQARHYNQLPVFATIGYTLKPLKSWLLSAEVGPALRMTFERGTKLDQQRDYSYGDLMGQIGWDYEWQNDITGSGRSIGLRVSRLFGLPNRKAAGAVDSLFAAFSWDL